MKVMKNLQQQLRNNPNNYTVHSIEGEFTLMINSPVYKTKSTAIGYYINTKTGENCGQCVSLHVQLCDGMTILDKPIFEEDCYELVYE